MDHRIYRSGILSGGAGVGAASLSSVTARFPSLSRALCSCTPGNGTSGELSEASALFDHHSSALFADDAGLLDGNCVVLLVDVLLCLFKLFRKAFVKVREDVKHCLCAVCDLIEGLLHLGGKTVIDYFLEVVYSSARSFFLRVSTAQGDFPVTLNVASLNYRGNCRSYGAGASYALFLKHFDERRFRVSCRGLCEVLERNDVCFGENLALVHPEEELFPFRRSFRRRCRSFPRRPPYIPAS